MTRVRFFDGQLLSARDLEAEQTYQIEKRRLHNRMLHGAGIVEGLGVSVENGAAEPVLVAPGFALDRNGNEILVAAPVRLDPGNFPRTTCFVTIQYTETATDPVSSTDGGVEYSRVTEGFTVAIVTEDPAGSADPQELALARLVRKHGQWNVDMTHRPRALARYRAG